MSGVSLVQRKLIIMLLTLLVSPLLMAQVPSPEQMWQIIQEQQKDIELLQAKLEETESLASQNSEAVDITANAVEQVAIDVNRRPDEYQRTSIGGYGELHYNNLSDDMLGDGDDALDRTDYHRFVLYVGHEFTENIRFFSELEIEHSLAGDGAPGEVELEQAWVEMDLTEAHTARAGLDILPIGIINSTHEPDTFYGVERNKVESEIIPATWWEAGIGLYGELAPGWNYDAVIHSGLSVPTTGNSALRPRSGRAKVAEADDLAFASTGRIRYTGIPGLEIGISGQYQSDITGTADNIGIDATLLESHLIWQHHSGIGLKALYARWDFSDDPLLIPDSINADSLDGWYLEPSYRFRLAGSSWGDIGLFARYSQWDERNRIDGAHRFEEFTQLTTGINWWPHDNVVFKFDVQWEDADGIVDRTLDGINLGLGYQF